MSHEMPGRSVRLNRKYLVIAAAVVVVGGAAACSTQLGAAQHDAAFTRRAPQSATGTHDAAATQQSVKHQSPGLKSATPQQTNPRKPPTSKVSAAAAGHGSAQSHVQNQAPASSQRHIAWVANASSSKASQPAGSAEAGAAAPATDSNAGASTPAAAAAAGSCVAKPSESNTGATGSLSAGSTTVLNKGDSLSNTSVSDLTVQGDNVTVRNVKVNGDVLITGNHVTLDHVSAKSIGISSATDVTVQYANISNSDDDAIHITSDRGTLARNITLDHNYIHDPRVPADAHYDGTQVRGVNNLTINCSNYDPGAYQPTFNAGIFLQDANGGASNVTIAHNWLDGFGYALQIEGKNISLIGNQISGDSHWGDCRLGDGNPNLVSTGNTDSNNKTIKLCAAAGTR